MEVELFSPVSGFFGLSEQGLHGGSFVVLRAAVLDNPRMEPLISSVTPRRILMVGKLMNLDVKIENLLTFELTSRVEMMM